MIKTRDAARGVINCDRWPRRDHESTFIRKYNSYRKFCCLHCNKWAIYILYI